MASPTYKDNEEAYSQLLGLLLSSLKVETDAKEKVFNVLSATEAMITRRNNTSPPTQNELKTLQQLKDEATTFLSYQNNSLSATRIQTVWRRYQAMKKYKQNQKIYVQGRNTRVHDMLQREVGYTRLISQLAQRYAVPLLNTTDRLLKEEGADIFEILKAVVAIERLHRGLLRKFRGFVDEGCDWPNIDGFGNIFLDLQEEFRAYGDFIKQFKYTIDLVDQLDLQTINRPRLTSFFQEHSYDNVGFKALLSKPLNQIASYELGLQQMADSTSPEDPDFKVLMKALSIISETNKYVTACLNLSYNTAEIKKMERRIVLKPSRGQSDLVKIYQNLVKDAHYVEEMQTELLMKRGVKKRTPACINFFSNMILVSVAQQKKGGWKAKRLYTIPFLRVDTSNSNTCQITATTPTEDLTLQGKDIPNTTIQLRCDSTQQMRDIVDRIQNLKEATQANRVFGIDLSIIIEREDRDIAVPRVLQILCEYILEHFTDTVGLFRVPGSAQTEKALCAAFNETGGEDIDLASFNPSAADVAGLIKLYFRDLPRPLTGDLFVNFVDAQKKYSSEELRNDMTRELRRLVAKLPPYNRETLKYMCEFMYQVAQHKEVNKMDCSNVAMCVGPDLMKPPVDSIELALMVPQANEALARMVEHNEEVFKEF